MTDSLTGSHDVTAEQPNRADLTSSTLMPPCPWWCRSTDADHENDYDSTLADESAALSRAHVHEFGDGDLAVVQYETNRNGVVTLDAPRISVYVDQVKNAAAAARLSFDLDAAALLLRRIEAEGDAR